MITTFMVIDLRDCKWCYKKKITNMVITDFDMPANRYKPTPRECTLLFLHLIEARETETGKSMTRARLSEITLKRLWNRERLTEQFLAEVEEWFLTEGWALVYAGSTYAAVKTDAVQNWPRVSSKRIRADIESVGKGEFDFNKLEELSRSVTHDRYYDDEGGLPDE
jgi:hypothetical protein